ncbi:unnamed protein product [Linum trigynum]|uniref:Uncharacterized protein n=1 Tax=Linum trigynum TaxID=586398 RepID=A0AAV2ES81_9ROSI
MTDSMVPLNSHGFHSSTSAQSKSVKTNPSLSPTGKSSSSYAPLLSKLFIFLLFLLAIPLLPSHAPELFNGSFLSNLWDLAQLLFVGVAVSYGLFSRRNAELDYFDNALSTVDESQSSFVSRIFQVSPLFEECYEVPSGSVEKTISHATTGAVHQSVATYACYDAYAQHQSVAVENGFEMSGGDEVIQAWSSHCFHGESMVVLSQPNTGLDELGQCEKRGSSRKPLGLPVRSLNPRVSEFVMPDVGNVGVPAAQGKRDDTSDSSEGLFGEVGPVNLEEKFKRTVDYSEHSWGSKSGMMERKETGKLGADRDGHFRPLSVDEIQFESLKSESFGLSKDPFSAKARLMQHSATTQYLSVPLSSDPPNSYIEESGVEKKPFPASYPPVTILPSAKVSGDSPLNAFHLRKYSNGGGSLFKKESQGNLRGVLKEKDLRSAGDALKSSVQYKRDDEDIVKKNQRSVKLENKVEDGLAAAKRSPKGRSVRTIRSACSATTTEVKLSYLDGEVRKASAETEAVNTIKRNHVAAKVPKPMLLPECKRRESRKSSAAPVNFVDEVGKTYGETEGGGTSKKNDVGQTAKEPFAEYKKRDSRKSSARVSVEPDEYLESKKDKFQLCLDQQRMVDNSGEVGHDHDPNEVDRKAGEFIAKFREQIRLQKVASVERSSRKRGIGKDY